MRVPSATADLSEAVEIISVPIRKYENFICSLTYDETTINLGGADFPDTPETLHQYQSCGYIPVYKWNFHTYDQVGNYGSDD